MFKFKNMMCILALLAVVTVPTSCGVMDWVNQQEMVLTTLSQVQEGQRGEAVILPTEEIPEQYRESWKDETVVMVPKESLVGEAAFVPLSTESSAWDSNAFLSLAQGALSVGSTFIPQLAGFEALLLLLFRRKRKHYKNALVAMAPTGEGMNFVEGAKSIGKALGMSHSSTGTEEVFEEEEEAEE
jgi:hypothetical protein